MRIALVGVSVEENRKFAELIAAVYGLEHESFRSVVRWGLREMGVPAPYEHALVWAISEALREWNRNHLVSLLAERLAHSDEKQTGVVIDDVTHPEEYRFCRENGFLLVATQPDPVEPVDLVVDLGDPVTSCAAVARCWRELRGELVVPVGA